MCNGREFGNYVVLLRLGDQSQGSKQEDPTTPCRSPNTLSLGLRWVPFPWKSGEAAPGCPAEGAGQHVHFRAWPSLPRGPKEWVPLMEWGCWLGVLS